ncbi:unnamed protein product, partial [Iphiclides podalirius]
MSVATNGDRCVSVALSVYTQEDGPYGTDIGVTVTPGGEPGAGRIADANSYSALNIIPYKSRIVLSAIYYRINRRNCTSPTLAVLGFLWSKPKLDIEKKEDVSILLEKADVEFDNGHYEDCYHILIQI